LQKSFEHLLNALRLSELCVSALKLRPDAKPSQRGDAEFAETQEQNPLFQEGLYLGRDLNER